MRWFAHSATHTVPSPSTAMPEGWLNSPAPVPSPWAITVHVRGSAGAGRGITTRATGMARVPGAEIAAGVTAPAGPAMVRITASVARQSPVAPWIAPGSFADRTPR